mmetsp:Transcript_10856/g.28080  ORF Transcript_10856/g.28080 Transcript_10856/m.28080 type:complete len:272 (+) Transcript_10856:529-1344(+)
MQVGAQWLDRYLWNSSVHGPRDVGCERIWTPGGRVVARSDHVHAHVWPVSLHRRAVDFSLHEGCYSRGQAGAILQPPHCPRRQPREPGRCASAERHDQRRGARGGAGASLGARVAEQRGLETADRQRGPLLQVLPAPGLARTQQGLPPELPQWREVLRCLRHPTGEGICCLDGRRFADFGPAGEAPRLPGVAVLSRVRALHCRQHRRQQHVLRHERNTAGKFEPRWRQRVSASVPLFHGLGPRNLTAAVVVGVGRARASDRLSAFGPARSM